jgi:hypothetical protein
VTSDKEQQMSDDHSPGDARKPYSDEGGPAARHAQTHDVRREQMTNPSGPEERDTSFDQDLAGQTPQAVREAHLDAEAGSDDKTVGARLPELTDDELSRLSILEPGTSLEQGSVYLDVANRGRGPFKAIGGMEAEGSQKLIAKSMTDYELWNAIAGRDDAPEIERPR